MTDYEQTSLFPIDENSEFTYNERKRSQEVSELNESNIHIYKDSKGDAQVTAYLTDNDLWLSIDQLSKLYRAEKSALLEQIKCIFEDKELEESLSVQTFQVNPERQTEKLYNLDVVIALGYRVQSQDAVNFRRWAIKSLHEYIQKGFALDDERLKQGGSRYFRELLQRIRDIRSSERNFYQQVTDIYATATDYDSKSELTRNFFATVQNKLHFAVHEHTASEVIYERVDSDKPFVGMTSFKGSYVTREDVKIAKNYLSEIELTRLNLMVSQFLDYAELQALEHKPMTMQDWIDALDNQILVSKRNLLEDNGKISHEQAIEKAECEFEMYREREMKQLESDFDKALKALKTKN